MESETTHNGQSREDIEDLIEHCIPRPPLPPRIDDTVFQEISYLLDQHPDPFFQKWGSNPRTYTLLRMLGYDEDSTVFTTFDLEQIGDVLLPLWPKYLPKSLTDSGLSSDDFRRIQPHVLSRPELLNESNFLSNVHSHRYIIGGKAHFDELEELGHGGSAKVERVRHKLTGKCFACKRISRGSTLKVQRDQLVEFEQELNILKRVRHKHIVNYVGSYTDFDSFSLILSPVADLVLKALLQRQDRNNPLSSAHLGCLRSAFGCLATAIAFVHDERIRHKDIKPGNILISQGKIYLCDFGISRDWSMNDHSTTEGPVPRYTPRYAAPEVTDKNRRNESWDIWSLGCVFLEMITVIEGYPLSEMDDFLCRVSGGLSVHGLCYASNEIRLWLNHLRSGSTNNTCLDWISDMVEEEAEKRPKAKSVVQMIQEHSHGFPASAFIGQCCMRFDSVVSNDQVNYPALQVTPTTGLRIDFNATPCGRDSTQKSPATPGSRIAERPQISRDRSLSPKAQENARGGSVVDAISLPPAPGSLHGGFSSGHASTHSLPSSKASRGQSVSLPEHSTASSRLSPIPHPSELQVDCLCGSRSYERHIFNAKVSFYSADESVRSIETCERCEVPELRVQLYETPPEDPSTATVGAQPQETLISKVWWITRRLVISHCADSPAKWRCCSFWLPLADLSFQIAGDEVTLAWSDCNQMRLKSSGNYGESYDWVYEPKHPNNRLELRFVNATDAIIFTDCLRFPVEDGIVIRNGQRVAISGTQEAQIYDIGRKSSVGRVLDYRIIALTNHAPSGSLTSKLYIRWPDLDFDMRLFDADTDPRSTIPDYHMTLKIDHLATPTYHSNVRDEPAVNHSKVARFNKALQLKSSMVVTFPIGMKHTLPTPPEGVVALLSGLTGWSLRYFGILPKHKSRSRRISRKKNGPADVMLWEKESEVPPRRYRSAQITFRSHGEQGESESTWMSGSINHLTTISTSSAADATITFAHKARGTLLDVVKMTAIDPERPSAPKETLSELILTFLDGRYRLEFLNLIEKFKTASAAQASSLMPRSISSGQAEPFRTIDSLASAEFSPPMRISDASL